VVDYVDTGRTVVETQAEIRKRKRDENKAAYKASVVPARKPIATAAGTKSRMTALREMLLKDHNTHAVLSKVLSMALDDEHPGQVAALKMCVDRMMPVSMFEEKKDGARTAITISITGIGESKMNVIEGEVVE
jgi:hypothetical protein